MQDPDVSVKRKTARFRAVKNRGTRGDSLLMLSPSGLSNRKPLLLSDSESGGSMSQNDRSRKIKRAPGVISSGSVRFPFLALKNSASVLV